MTTRRTFVAALTAAQYSRVRGANEKVQLGVVGIGGRGRDHVNFFAGLPDCQVAAVCDVNQEARERAEQMVLKLTGQKPQSFTDMREMFASKAVDAVSVATPNHWHALAAIWACQAGKDVYLEKPASHNVWEGGKIVEAARKYGRMVQVGSQSRSNGHKIKAMQLLREGVIGKLYLAKGLCYKRRKSIGHTPDEPVPAGIDWNLFLGPAQMKEFSWNKFRYNWHWFWDTGNGDIGNQGVHEMDIARWGLGVTGMPKNVVSTGGKFVYEDDQETPNTQTATYDFGNVQIVFEVRGLITNPEHDIMIGNLFYGEDGVMAIDSRGFWIYKGEKLEKVMEEKQHEPRGYDPAPHMANFLQAVKSRKHTDLNADIEVGAAAAAMCHLGNISYRLRRGLSFDPTKGRFADNDANEMLTRKYRAPYAVPERI